jgi:hypothetical protein
LRGTLQIHIQTGPSSLGFRPPRVAAPSLLSSPADPALPVAPRGRQEGSHALARPRPPPPLSPAAAIGAGRRAKPRAVPAAAVMLLPVHLEGERGVPSVGGGASWFDGGSGGDEAPWAA